MTELQTQNSGALANTGHDPFAAYGEEASRGNATFVKFSKGEWLVGKDENTDHVGKKFVANMDGLTIGWVHWRDNRPDDRRMGRLIEGFRPAGRGELGDEDQTTWPKDTQDRPQDPWQKTNELPLADSNGEQYVFSATSTGAIGAIGNLCKAYSKEARLRDGKVPVVELGTDSYKHTTYGKVWVPMLTIVDWVDNVAPAAANDPAPEPEPAKAAAGGGKTRF